MKNVMMLLTFAFSATAHAELKLASSDIVLNQAKVIQKMSDGREFRIFPATISLTEVDDQNGSIRLTKIKLDLNQIKTTNGDYMMGEDPQDAAGPWLLIGIGTNEAHMKIENLAGKTIGDLLDKPFKGSIHAFGLIAARRNVNTVNQKGIMITDKLSAGLGIDNSQVEFTLSSKNVSIETSFNNSSQSVSVPVDSVINYQLN